MVRFSEAFVGGFFGFRRTYGAVAHFECDSAAALEADWLVALRKAAEWRAVRKERATALHMHVLVPPALAWHAVAFAVARVAVPPPSLADELRGLSLVVAVFGAPDMEQYFDLTLYREATGGRSC
jgi:hypothetical protein